MRVYCIRHIPSGMFIPRLETGKTRGGSHLEPSNDREPRIFHNKRAAMAFLGSWLQGIFVNERHQYGLDDWDVYATPRKQPHRIKENMEIVEFELHEVGKPISSQTESKSYPFLALSRKLDLEYGTVLSFINSYKKQFCDLNDHEQKAARQLQGTEKATTIIDQWKSLQCE